MIYSSVNRLGFMSIPFPVMDSTHFWRKFWGSGQHASGLEISQKCLVFAPWSHPLLCINSEEEEEEEEEE
jgi:hypothetical protein